MCSSVFIPNSLYIVERIFLASNKVLLKQLSASIVCLLTVDRMGYRRSLLMVSSAVIIAVRSITVGYP